MDLLDIPGLKSVRPRIDNNSDKREYRIFAEIVEGQNYCPQCGSLQLHPSGSHTRVYRDSPLRGYRVVIEISKVRRYKCEFCETAFLQDVPGMDQVRRMTRRCVRYISDRGMRDTYQHVAQHVGCNDKTVFNICKEFMWQIREMKIPYMPEWLGIDETFIGGKYRCVLTDINRKRVIDMLPDKYVLTIGGWLWDLKGKTKLEGVTMDMSKDFRRVIREQFKDVPIVADKWHVLSKANDAVDKVRNRLQAEKNKKKRQWWNSNKGLLRARYDAISNKGKEKLDEWLEGEPELAKAHKLKEQFFKIYDFMDRSDAETVMDEWRDDVIKTGMEAAFSELLGVLYEKEKKPRKPPKRPPKQKPKEKKDEPKHWKNEVLAYFDHRDKTNALCESMNNLAKTLNRAGRGYEFEHLRARVLYVMKPLEPELHREPTEDNEEDYRYQTLRDITRMYDALVARYGNLCSECHGVFEKNLERFLGKSVSIFDWHLAEKRFHLRCGECGKEFNLRVGDIESHLKPNIQPDIPNTQRLRAALIEREKRVAKHAQRMATHAERKLNPELVPSKPKKVSMGRRRRRRRSRWASPADMAASLF